MTGLSENHPLQNVLWPDADIESITIEYEEVRISVEESTGRKMTVTCRGHIGYSMAGFWDETIVERADCDRKDPFLAECLRSLESRYGQKWSDTGSPERNLRSWNVLRIFLSDGAVLKIAAAQFIAEESTTTRVGA